VEVSRAIAGRTSSAPDGAGQPLRLPDQVRVRRLGLASRTEEAYVSCTRRFIKSQPHSLPRGVCSHQQELSALKASKKEEAEGPDWVGICQMPSGLANDWLPPGSRPSPTQDSCFPSSAIGQERSSA
jgi:hypothetical protein